MNDRAAWQGIDNTTMGLWLAVLLVGVAMVGSASIERSLAATGGAFGFALRHSVYVLGAIVVALGVFLVPLQRWQRYGRLGYLLGLLLLTMVLVDFLGREVNGASRWLDLRVLTVQPSELMKFAFVVFLARHLALTYKEIGSVQQVVRTLAALGVVGALLMLEPDFGTTVVLAATTFGVLALVGARIPQLIVVAVVGAGLFVLLLASEPYRWIRFIAFSNPWDDTYGTDYQLAQALIAFGRGEWFGLGIGDSVQKLFYLPEAHNDFLFAVIAEETGMVGATVVIVLLLAIAVRILLLGRKAELRGQRFAAYATYGIGCLIGLQTLVNVGVNTGLLPTKGLTLPFVSYGGNSLVASGALIGFVLRVHWELTHPPERNTRGR